MAEIRIIPSTEDYIELLPQLVYFEHQWEGNELMSQTLGLVDDVISRIRQYVDAQSKKVEHIDELERLSDLLDCFFLDLAFSSTSQEVPESMLNSLSYLVRFHTGEALSMSIMLNHILHSLGFDCSIVVIEHELMLKVDLSSEQYAIIDPVSGEQQTCVLDEQSGVLPDQDCVVYRMLDKFSLLQIYLTQQKMAFTQELHFDKALLCIEMLMETTPDDPYQRRDRGFVLHQLECHEHARNDFEFFIDQCPEDPAAELLKLQLEELDGGEFTVH